MIFFLGAEEREGSFSMLLLSTYSLPGWTGWALKDSKTQSLSSGGLQSRDRVSGQVIQYNEKYVIIMKPSTYRAFTKCQGIIL